MHECVEAIPAEFCNDRYIENANLATSNIRANAARKAAKSGVLAKAYRYSDRAIDYVGRVADGTEKADRGRLEACKMLFNLVGLPEPAAAEKADKPLHSQSRAELMAAIQAAERARAELAARAAPILDVEPGSAQEMRATDSQAVDMFD